MEKICPICERHCQMTALGCKRGNDYFSLRQMDYGHPEQQNNRAHHCQQPDFRKNHHCHDHGHLKCEGQKRCYYGHLKSQIGQARLDFYEHLRNQACFDFHEHLREHKYHPCYSHQGCYNSCEQPDFPEEGHEDCQKAHFHKGHGHLTHANYQECHAEQVLLEEDPGHCEQSDADESPKNPEDQED